MTDPLDALLAKAKDALDCACCNNEIALAEAIEKLVPIARAARDLRDAPVDQDSDWIQANESAKALHRALDALSDAAGKKKKEEK